MRRAYLPRACLLLVLAGALAPSAAAEDAAIVIRRREPSIGYAWPAGGRVGTTVDVDVGGQLLREMSAVRVSGDGVTGTLLTWVPPPRPLPGAQARTLRRLLAELVRARTTGGPAPRMPPAPAEGEEPALPEHPLLEGLSSLDLRGLDRVARYFLTPRDPLQRKRSIEETVRVRLRIAADAEPGVRELRLHGDTGVTNAVRFRVGLLPEVAERDPVPPQPLATPPVDTPVVINGQILPRDEDRFRVRAKGGQTLVLRLAARALVPFQADSVPGWFQATLAVEDAAGRELLFADEHDGDPDPVLAFTVPEDGEYVVVVRDAIHRGREDFVYRLTIGELPHVERIFPLGGQRGTLVQAQAAGWNLHWPRIPLDTRAAGACRRQVAWRQGEAMTNEIRYAVGTCPEQVEAEPNDCRTSAPAIETPQVINGRIDRPGDMDLFRVEGRRGRTLVAELTARELGSPLDGTLRVLDEDGEVVAWNDDAPPEGLGVRAFGLATHHADPYLRVRLPRTGTYFVQVADARRHGGPAHAYRLRLGPPEPDAAVFVAPSAVNVPAGRTTRLTAYVLRKDGQQGPIDLELVDPPPGFALAGATIPAGRDRVELTLTAPASGQEAPVALRLRARCRIGREVVERAVSPADEVMQAFLWRHLVPAEELLVAVIGEGKHVPVVSLADETTPVRLPRGRHATVAFQSTQRLPVDALRLVLVDGPRGISLGAIEARHDGFTLEIHASRDAVRTGRPATLIVEAFVERTVERPDGSRRRYRTSLGHLPAIPYIVRRSR